MSFVSFLQHCSLEQKEMIQDQTKGVHMKDSFVSHHRDKKLWTGFTCIMGYV